MQDKQHSLFLADIQQKIAEEIETKLLVRQAKITALELMNSKAYKSANLEDETLKLWHQNFLAGLARIKDIKRYLVEVKRARECAESQYLTATEHKFVLDYKNAQGQEYHLRKLLHELSKLPETYKENQPEFCEIRRMMEKKISNLQIFLSRNRAHLCEIEEKLQSPYRRKNVELVVHGILQRNLEVLNELKKASNAVLKNVETLRSKIKMREEPKTIFTAKEVRNVLARQYRYLKKLHEENIARQFRLMRKRVTAAEALEKAKNFFVHGAFKKLCAEQQVYKKALANHEREESENQKRQMSFNRTNWTNSAEKFQAQYYLKKESVWKKQVENCRRLKFSWIANPLAWKLCAKHRNRKKK